MDKPVVEYCELYEDGRGSVYCAKDELDKHKIKRTYVVKNWSKGLIRAWHGHKNGWTGLHVIKGAFKIVVRKMKDLSATQPSIDSNTDAFWLSDRKPGIVWIPPGYYHGHKSLEDDSRLLVYSTQTFEEVKKDDVRYPFSKKEDMFFFDEAVR